MIFNMQLKDDVIILISTHNIEEIENVIDRCIVLDNGSIKEEILIDDLNKEGKDLRALLDTYRPKLRLHPSPSLPVRLYAHFFPI